MNNMWFEGRCIAREFPKKVKDAVTTIDISTGTPFWQMISSNVGTTLTDDGYVFYSQGSDGLQNIYWGIKSEQAYFFDSTQQHFGFKAFVANKYTPSGTNGTNGVFQDVVSDATPFSFNLIGFNNSIDNLPVRYWISVKKDRVVIAYVTDAVGTNTIRNVMYFGRPTLFDAKDKGSFLISAMGYTNTGYGTAYGTYNMSTGKGTQSNTLSSAVSSVNRFMNDLVTPSSIMILDSGEPRGILDVYIIKQDGKLRPIDTLKVGVKSYFTIQVPYYKYLSTYASTSTTYTLYNNFTSDGSSDMCLVIPKD